MPKQDIKNLVEKYEDIKNSGRLKSYSEEQTKKDFILPLFEILGWDVYSSEEVSAEETISSERVDYGFYLNDRIKFYLEAKKFNVDIHDEKFANQAIKYSFNKGATWAVLTNFETLIIFNAQDIEGKLSDKRFFEINCNEFLDRFGQLSLLSKESFRRDLLDKEAEKVGKKIQKISVSNLLYKDLQNCRDILTKDLGQWNDKIDPDLLDEGVQKLLDRLLFIRVAEDRGIEPSALIPMVRQARTDKGGELYQAMTEKFREFDGYYNSNLFSPHPFEKWEEYSFATEQVIHILYGKEGYYEYDFKAMPADVLGTVYENYLSHRLSKSKKGTTVSKDANKRKEEGIYYTPSYIVDYIVKNTLGPVLDKCKTIHDLKKIKVLDPACGSGSFLIKALEMINNKYKKLGSPGDTYTKIQILTENIYGVDFDQQAVEITRLNLLISALSRREKLPFLDNIKNGNSLISGPDEELQKYFGKDFRSKKPFNWQEQFSGVFKQGGFDVIVGNPPYIFARGGGFEESEKQYYYDHYKLQKYQLNTFSLFIERGINFLKRDGQFGFIVPNNWLTINSFAYLREYLLNNTADLKIINATDPIFSHAQVDTCVLMFKKEQPTNIQLGEIKDSAILNLDIFKVKDFLKDDFIIRIPKIKDEKSSILDKFNNCVPLSDVATVKSGFVAYEVGKGNPTQTKEMKDERIYHSNKNKGRDWYKYLDGKDVKRYSIDWSGQWVKYGEYLAAPRIIDLYKKPRILVRQIPSPLPYAINASIVREKMLMNDRNSMIVLDFKDGFDMRYVLGVINSRLISYWFAVIFDKFQRKIFPQFKVNELERFPIYKANTKEQKIIIQLVDKVLVLIEESLKIVENSEKWISIKLEIKKIDKKIDEEVYKLYGLVKDEINVLENIGHK